MPDTPPAPSPLRHWIGLHIGSAVSSFSRLWRKPLAALFTVSVMALALALPLGLWLALHQLGQLPTALERTRAIELFLTADIDSVQAQALAAQLRTLDTVAAVEHLSPEAGLAELRAQGLGDVAGLIGDDNPLPHLLRVLPAGDDAPLLEQLAQMPEIEWMQHDAHWQQQVEGWLLLGQRLAWGLSLLFGMGSMLIAGNTVRLDLQTRREEMQVLQLLGATPGFIRRPYVYLGVWYGLFGGALALVLLTGALAGLAAPLAALFQGSHRAFSIQGFSGSEMLLILLGSATLGGAGARWVSGRVLRRSGVM